ncbi:MAG: hypothetical protein ACK5MJ_03600 [Alphaproteobacteria bacterium]
MNKLLQLLILVTGMFFGVAHAHGGHEHAEGIFHVLLHVEYMLPAIAVALVVSYLIYKKVKG